MDDDAFPVGWFVEINDRGSRLGWGLALERDEHGRVLVKLDRDPDEPAWFPDESIVQGSRPPWLKESFRHKSQQNA